MQLILATLLLAASAMAANVCGQLGYTGNTPDYYYDDSRAVNTLAKCQSHCLADSQCVSIAFGDKTCIHYNVPVTGNIEQDDDSPYRFYDRGCFAPATTTTTLRTSTTTRAPTTTTTTRASTTAAPVTTTRPATSTTTSAPSGTSIPAGCPTPSCVINTFSYFNSSHNNDCVNGGDGTKGCLDSNGQWCDPKTVAGCTNCGIDICSTGTPGQPVGYGPPDDVKIFGSCSGQSFTCEETNPQGIRRAEVGEGYVTCGSAALYINFVGSSVSPTGHGKIDIPSIFGPSSFSCGGGHSLTNVQYSVTLDYPCSTDSGNNVTCTHPSPITVLPSSFQYN